MLILLMGVSGSGKTTIGRLLSESLNWEFHDADAFHSPANIEKMRCGNPLNDADRMTWLQDLRTAIHSWLQENKNVVLACSALKAGYRQFLLGDSNKTILIYLKGDFELILHRLQKRQNHFMSEKLLKSQFDTLEEPSNAIYIDVSEPIERIVQKIRSYLNSERMLPPHRTAMIKE